MANLISCFEGFLFSLHNYVIVFKFEKLYLSRCEQYSSELGEPNVNMDIQRFHAVEWNISAKGETSYS